MAFSWSVQYRAFLWKIFLQRIKSPITTIVEFLLPCVFMLLLTVAFWLSTSNHVPAADYSETAPTNFSTLLPAFFCQDMTNPNPFGRRLPIAPCPPTGTATCLPFVRNGALCVRNASLFSRVMFGVYYANGPIIVPTFDAYLALSAYTTYDSRTRNPTFFSRSGQASLSHYGRLVLIDSSNESIGEEFMYYCRNASVLCAEVVSPESIFSSISDANDYLANNEGNVWAMVDLPDPTLGSEKFFTIRMNFTATPETFSSHLPFSKGLGDQSYLLYVNSGFLTLQNMIQNFYAQRRSESNSSNPSLTEVSPDAAGIFKYVNLYGPSLQPMPSPPYLENSFYSNWAYFMPLVAMLAALFPVAKLVSWIVEEKARRIRESMLIMGLRSSCMYLGWYTSALLTDVIASLLACIVLRIGFFSYVNFGVLFFLYFSFMQQNSALSFFLSTFFINPRVAGAVAAFVIFLCCIPFYSFPDGMSTARLIGMSILPCIAYSEAFNQLAMYSSFGLEYNFSNIMDGDFSVEIAIGMMWASTVLFLLLWVYLDQVLPSSVGRGRSPLFFLAPLRCCFSCFGKGNKSSSVSDPAHTRNTSRDAMIPETRGYSQDGVTVPTLRVNAGSVEEEQQGGEMTNHTRRKRQVFIEDDDSSMDPSDERTAAVFNRLRKVYDTAGFIGWLFNYFTGLRREGDRTVALRGVSFAMQYGQVNVLLGPNGCGKTTLLGIATGMLKPDSGDVSICGHNAAGALSKCRKHIGYCPQNDIVWSRLTVEQHLTFYARMKSDGNWNVEKQVDEIIEAMQLEAKRHTSAENLSGGQRRRLCVGIALIGRPEVLFLDEPTAGMDMRGRKAVYDALHDGREGRSVLISTHLLNEADRIGDRILLMKAGSLRGAGSSLFLKSQMGVGYVVTCVIDSCLSEAEEDVCISHLTEAVRAAAYPRHRLGYDGNNALQAIPSECKLLGVERRGREISFRFPLSLLSSTGSTIIGELEARRSALHLRSIGLSLTTLQDVFASITEDAPLMSTLSAASNSAMGTPMDNAHVRDEERGIAIQINGNEQNMEPFLGAAETDVCDDEKYYDQEAATFSSHFVALFMKRVHCAKRDVRLLVFQVILPIIFLAFALIIDLFGPSGQPGITLDASLYSGYKVPPYSQVLWATSSTEPDVFGVDGANMSNAFGSYYDPIRVPCMTSNCSAPLSSELIQSIMNHTATRYVALSLTGTQGAAGAPSSIIMHNASAPHAAAQALDALYNVVNYQLYGKDATLTARNVPMAMGAHEQHMVAAMRRVIAGIFILLPFTFIPGNTVSFMVREKESGSRHLQWLAGANAAAFWMSAMLFDFLCFLVTEALALAVFGIFKRTEFVGNAKTTGATVALFTMFGVSSIPFSYVLSFFFSSPFVAQNVVLVANFALGFLWVMGEQILGDVESLRGFVRYTTYILRVIPSVPFGEGTFILSGVELANLMFPDRKRPNLFALLHFEDGNFKGGIGTGLIYMACTLVVSLIMLVLLEYIRIQRVSFFFCNRSKWSNRAEPTSDDTHGKPLGAADVDESVVCEENDVCRYEAGRPGDCITLKHLTKCYRGTSSPAVDDLSLGVRRGEIVALLGLNGAGKTTTVSVLAGEVVPSSGAAYINHLSVLRSASRSYVGYCPQRDALLDKLSPYEHLVLYARLRGASARYMRHEIPRLLKALGLTAKQRAPASSLSGGNKRRLSLAIAMVGGTTSVLLDEPTAGMDVVARKQTCATVKRLTRDKSVILTTHLLDETEALADRVAFIARGRLRCVGTPQELKSRYTEDAVYAVSIVFADGEGEPDAAVAERLCACFETANAREGEPRAVDAAMQAELESTVGRTVTLRVRGHLADICNTVAAIREGKVEGIPSVSYVGATQPTLEDILLRD